MGHKDAHALPHGATGPSDHHAPYLGDTDPIAAPCEHPEANCDCLWVDIGGEG